MKQSRFFKSFSWLLIFCLSISLFVVQAQAFVAQDCCPTSEDKCPDGPPPPNTPFTLRARPGEDGILLEWTAPEDASKVIGYNIYRNTSSAPYGSPINDSCIKVLKYTDKKLEKDMKACYYIKAVYSDKSESSPSNEACIAPPGEPGAPGAQKVVIILTIGSKNANVNKKLVVLDVPPFIDSGRTFVPFRFIGESLGAEVGFTKGASGKVATVTYRMGRTNIVLHIGKLEATVNGKTVTMEVAPQILQGRTVIPLRFVTEALGCKVEWDGQKMQVTIIFPA